MKLQHGLTVPATFMAVRDLASHACASAVGAGVDEQWVFELELAVVETANNIVAHSQERENGSIELYLSNTGQPNGRLILEFHACGRPLAPQHIGATRMAPSEAESGRGLALISACVDELHYERKGDVNIWRLVKRLA